MMKGGEKKVLKLRHDLCLVFFPICVQGYNSVSGKNQVTCSFNFVWSAVTLGYNTDFLKMNHSVCLKNVK